MVLRNKFGMELTCRYIIFVDIYANAGIPKQNITTTYGWITHVC